MESLKCLLDSNDCKLWWLIQQNNKLKYAPYSMVKDFTENLNTSISQQTVSKEIKQIKKGMEDNYFVNLIKSGKVSNHWVNGKAGQFKDFDNSCLYRFCETDENCNVYLLREEEQKNLPVLACNFVAWLIKHWGETPKNIFQGYLQSILNKHKESHKNELDSWKPEFDSRIEREFYNQYRAKEEQWVKQSEAIFDFISDEEVQRIKDYANNYFEYVIQFETRTNPISQPEAAEQPKSDTDNPNTETPRYSLNTAKITEIYNFCTDTGVLDSAEISAVDFINAVNAANFKAIYDHAQQRKSKSKCKYIIFILSKSITGDGWYLKAAHSISTEPNRCSGINVPFEWKRQADVIK